MKATLTALLGLLAVVMLAACGGSQNAAVPQSVGAQSRVHKASGSSGDLLYIAGNDAGEDVGIYTYPQGQQVHTLKFTGPWGLCTDDSGNVWVTSYDGYADEYPHGGTKRIKKLYTGSYFVATGCDVDGGTGNLAVVSTAGFIVVFPNGSGSGIRYAAPFPAYKCAYDNKGNLFVDSIGKFQIAELPAGASQFTTITLDKAGRFAGGIRWDGDSMAVSTTTLQYHHVIYRFEVSGSQGSVTQTVKLKNNGKSGHSGLREIR